ncbi:type VI secretion system contractile sheath small subunit [Methylobacterium oryzae]|uniref:type VI secretion system contractile sheath small subunit n=1 Tax=Methylobacterium oryzae TaxID=334852 RepID=UPI002F2F05B1
MIEKEGSIAPKERINIRYVPATMGQISEAELPLKLVVLGNFLGKADTTPVEERRMISVDKNTLSTVMNESGIQKTITVRNVLDEHNGGTALSVNLKFESFMPAFRKRMQQILENEESRNRLIAELEALHQEDSNAS